MSQEEHNSCAHHDGGYEEGDISDHIPMGHNGADAYTDEDLDRIVKIQSLTRRRVATKVVAERKATMGIGAGAGVRMGGGGAGGAASFRRGSALEGSHKEDSANANGSAKDLRGGSASDDHRPTAAASTLIELPTEDEVEMYMDDPCASTMKTNRKMAETNRNKRHPFDTVDYSKPFNPKPIEDSSAGLQNFLRADKTWW